MKPDEEARLDAVIAELDLLNGDAVVALRKDRDDLARWKKEQLQVTAWWKEIDDFVRAHPDAVLGRSVAAMALEWLKERDELLKMVDEEREP